MTDIALTGLDLGLAPKIKDEVSKPAGTIRRSLFGILDSVDRLDNSFKDSNSQSGFFGFFNRNPNKGIASPLNLAVARFNNIEMLATNILGSFKSWVVAVGATIFGLNAIKNILHGILDVGNDVEDFFVKIANITGNERFAAGFIDWEHQILRDLPIMADQLREVSTLMTGLGVIPTTPNIRGIIAGGLGQFGDFQGINQSITQVSELAQNFDHTRESVASFQRIFNALDERRLFNLLSGTEFGLAGFESRVTILANELNGAYGDTIDRTNQYSKTLKGVIAEQIRWFKATIIGAPVVGSLFTDINNTTKKITDFFVRNEDAMRTLAQGITNIFKWMWGIVDRTLNSLLSPLDNFFKRVRNSGRDFVFDFINPLITFLEILRIKFDAFFSGFATGFVKPFQFIQRIAAPAIMLLGDALGVFFGQVLAFPLEKWEKAGFVIGLIAGSFALLKTSLFGLAAVKGILLAVFGGIIRFVALHPKLILLVGAVSALNFAFKNEGFIRFVDMVGVELPKAFDRAIARTIMWGNLSIDWLLRVKNAFMEFFHPVINVGSHVINSLMNLWKDYGESVTSIFNTTGRIALEWVRSTLILFRDFVNKDLPPIIKLIGTVFNGVMKFVSKSVIGSLKVVEGMFRLTIGTVVQLVNGDFMKAWESVKSGIVTIFDGLLDIITAPFVPFFQWFQDRFFEAHNAIVSRINWIIGRSGWLASQLGIERMELFVRTPKGEWIPDSIVTPAAFGAGGSDLDIRPADNSNLAATTSNRLEQLTPDLPESRKLSETILQFGANSVNVILNPQNIDLSNVEQIAQQLAPAIVQQIKENVMRQGLKEFSFGN